MVRCIVQPRWRGRLRSLDRLAFSDRHHGDPGLELGTVGAALAQLLRRRLRQRWEPLSLLVLGLRG